MPLAPRESFPEEGELNQPAVDREEIRRDVHDLLKRAEPHMPPKPKPAEPRVRDSIDATMDGVLEFESKIGEALVHILEVSTDMAHLRHEWKPGQTTMRAAISSIPVYFKPEEMLHAKRRQLNEAIEAFDLCLGEFRKAVADLIQETKLPGEGGPIRAVDLNPHSSIVEPEPEVAEGSAPPAALPDVGFDAEAMKRDMEEAVRLGRADATIRAPRIDVDTELQSQARESGWFGRKPKR